MQRFDPPITEQNFIGLNDTDPSELIPNGMFTKAENAYVADNKIEKVPGSSSIGTASTNYPLNGLSSFEDIVNGNKYIITSVDGASNAQLYKWTGSGNFSAIGSANLTKSSTVMFETANNYLFGFNGDEVVDFDGTTVTKNRAGIPLGYYPKWFHNYLFVGRSDAYPNRLWWSDLSTPTTFTGANYVDVNPGDSDMCQGIGILSDELFYFKRNTIWSISGWSGSTFSATTITTQNTNARLIGYGCVAPMSIISAGNDIYFMSYLGSTPIIRSLRKTQYATTLGGGIVSRDIKTTMDSITKTSIEKTVGIFDGRYAMWAIPTASSTSNNKIIALDTWTIRKIKGETVYSWITMSGKNAKHFTISTISGSQLVYFSTTSATSGKVFKIDTGVYTDDGSAVVMDVRSKDYMLDVSRKAKWKYLYLKYKTGYAGTLDVYARGDQAEDFTNQESISLAGNSPGLGPTGTFTLGTSVLGGSAIAKDRITFKHLTASLLGLKFYEDSSSACTIYEYQILGRRKGYRDD